MAIPLLLEYKVKDLMDDAMYFHWYGNDQWAHEALVEAADLLLEDDSWLAKGRKPNAGSNNSKR